MSPSSDSPSLRLQRACALASPVNCHSPDHATKGTPSSRPQQCCFTAVLLQPPPSDGWYAGGFRICFIPLPGTFSPFPHGTRAISVADGILALGRGRPSFPHGSTARVVLTTPAPPGASARRLRDFHPLWPAFPHRSAATLVLAPPGGPPIGRSTTLGRTTPAWA